MKTIKLFLALVASVLALSTFSSCTKNNASGSMDMLYGTWDINHAKVSGMGVNMTLSRNEIFTIGRQMMGQDVYFLDATLVITDKTINGLSYEMKGNKLVKLGDTDMTEFGMSFINITSTSMTLRYEMMGIVEDMVYMKRE